VKPIDKWLRLKPEDDGTLNAVVKGDNFAIADVTNIDDPRNWRVTREGLRRLAPDGTLKAAKGIEAGKMTMNIGLTRKLVTEDFSGSVRDGQLHFVLHITSSMLGITMADATLTFDGESK
jgi:hypothetical protein